MTESKTASELEMFQNIKTQLSEYVGFFREVTEKFGLIGKVGFGIDTRLSWILPAGSAMEILSISSDEVAHRRSPKDRSLEFSKGPLRDVIPIDPIPLELGKDLYFISFDPREYGFLGCYEEPKLRELNVKGTLVHELGEVLLSEDFSRADGLLKGRNLIGLQSYEREIRIEILADQIAAALGYGEVLKSDLLMILQFFRKNSLTNLLGNRNREFVIKGLEARISFL